VAHLRRGGPAGAFSVAALPERERRAGAGGRAPARRARRIELTGARAVAGAVGAADVARLLVGALVQRIGPGRHDRAGPARTGQVARHAGAVTGVVAADALRAVRGGAVGVGRAGGPGRLLGAGAAEAEVARRAVGIDGAARLADAGRVADVGVAHRGDAGPAGASAVALAGRRGEARRAGVCPADGARGVELAAAFAVTPPVGLAGRPVLLGALIGRILAGGDVDAGAGAPLDRARLAGAGAGGGAADALRAVGRLAVGVGAAAGARWLGTAAASDAEIVARAVGVGRAGRLARAGRAAGERRAGLTHGRLAGPGAVAPSGEEQRRPGAAGRLTGDARHVELAGAGAVAVSVGAAARRPLVHAIAVGIRVHVGREAGPGHVPRASHADPGAGAVAADAVGAEAGDALRGAAAGLPERLGPPRRVIGRRAHVPAAPGLTARAGAAAAHVLLRHAAIGAQLGAAAVAAPGEPRQDEHRRRHEESAHPRLGGTYGHGRAFLT